MSDNDEWLAAAKHGKTMFLLGGLINEFILDYRKYDPDFCNTREASDWRNGVLVVSDLNLADFLSSLRGREISAEQGRELALQGERGTSIIAAIDFDRKEFTHAYYDLPLEDYLPKGWKGRLGDPVKVLLDWSSEI